jgi:PAS domain S-box-containing protein
MSAGGDRARTAARYLGAVTLGVAALLINQLSVPLLTTETPRFMFGGALVLAAFIRFGTWPGIVSTIVSLSLLFMRPDWADWAAAATIVYMAEALVACTLYRRFRGLTLAVLVYWLAVGWILDALLYHWLVGFSAEYVTLLFIKQIFNGILNALIAEALLRIPLPSWIGEHAEPRAPLELRTYVFNRTMLVVMVPVSLLALTFTRTAYEEQISRADAQGQRAARNVGVVVTQFVQQRDAHLDRLAHRVELARSAHDTTATAALLDEFHRAQPEFRIVALVDSEGTIVASTPERTLDGVRIIGRSLKTREYFKQAKSEFHTVYAPLILGVLRVRSGEREPSLVIAEPIVDRAGHFQGIIAASLDIRALTPLLTVGRDRPGELVTLFDGDRQVVATLDQAFPLGMQLRRVVPEGALDGTSASSFRYVPPRDTTLASRLAIDVRHSSYQPVAMSGWGVMVDLPSQQLYQAMMPAAYEVLAFFLVFVLVLYLVVYDLSRRVADPLLEVNRTATLIAGGSFPAVSPPAELAASPIRELRDLASHFATMQTALLEKHAVSEARQEETEERFRATFEQAAVGILHRDLDTRILRVNEKYCEIVGYTREELIGTTVDFITHPEDMEVGRRVVPRLLSGEIQTAVLEARLARKGGGYAWTQGTLSLVRDPATGEPKYFIAVVEDISTRKELEQQLLQAQKMKAVGQLAGGLAHDFNNLLTPIIAYADMALSDLEPHSPLWGDVSQIRTAADRARTLTQQLLAFGRRQVLEMRVLDLADVIAQFKHLLRPVMREDIALDIRLETPLPSIKGDAAKIEQILMNLAVNAIDAMPGGGRLMISASAVTIGHDDAGAQAAGLVGRCVLLTVADTGHGIDAATMEHLFEPFFTTKAQGKGTGLGLATVYGIIRQHGGDVSVRSSQGRGTTFSIYFPAVNEVPERVPAAPSTQHAARGSETVLIVEDEPIVRELVRNTLVRHGYTVLDSSSATDAVHIAEAYQGQIDLVLTDVIMPQMNGREVFERVSGVHPEAVALYISGYAGEVIAKQGVLEPGIELVQKPFSVHELTRRVRQVLDARQTTGAAERAAQTLLPL